MGIDRFRTPYNDLKSNQIVFHPNVATNTRVINCKLFLLKLAQACAMTKARAREARTADKACISQSHIYPVLFSEGSALLRDGQNIDT